jgi:CelD/BcsL family acetyltransferase involved in cellulose biosynthesis
MSDAEALSIDDATRWREILPARESVFGSVEFAAIQQEHAGADPRLITVEHANGRIAHPLLLRSSATLPFGERVDGTLFDATTPEYSGPFAAGPLKAGAGAVFSDALSSWCELNHVVTEFGHLHPWKARTELLDPAGLELDREIVYVDLTLDEDRLWRESFTHACRKNINRARREGVRVLEATSPAEVDELHRIYEMTMDRQEALEGYYFPPGYFRSFREHLRDHSRILLAEHEGKVIAATLYLHDDSDAYSYLGGADHAFQRLRPTNAIVYEMISWARAQGKQRLVLGGGYGPGDGILRFKASFSPLRAPFHVYKRVHLPDAYAAVSGAWRDYYGVDGETTGFFPPYRAVPGSGPQSAG